MKSLGNKCKFSNGDFHGNFFEYKWKETETQIVGLGAKKNWESEDAKDETKNSHSVICSWVMFALFRFQTFSIENTRFERWNEFKYFVEGKYDLRENYEIFSQS